MHISTALATCWLLPQVAFRAFARPREDRNRIAARIAMIAITTNSSIRVNARRSRSMVNSSLPIAPPGTSEALPPRRNRRSARSRCGCRHLRAGSATATSGLCEGTVRRTKPVSFWQRPADGPFRARRGCSGPKAAFTRPAGPCPRRPAADSRRSPRAGALEVHHHPRGPVRHQVHQAGGRMHHRRGLTTRRSRARIARTAAIGPGGNASPNQTCRGGGRPQGGAAR